MQEGDEAPGPQPKANQLQHDDPVVAFLFEQELGQAPAGPVPTRPAPHASRSISRLTNNRGTLYLPTLQARQAKNGTR